MSLNLKSKIKAAASFIKKHVAASKSLLVAIGTMATLLVMPSEAAAAVSLPFIDGIGCTVVQYLKGPMAIVIFMIVLVSTLVVGMISKMDWGKIIGVVVIFGLLQGLGIILITSGMIGLPSCMTL